MSRAKTKLAGYLIVLIVAFGLLFVRTAFLNPFKFSVAEKVSWPVRLIQIPLQEAKKVLYYHRTFDEYIRLREEVNLLRARLVGVEELSRENNRLASLLGLKRELIYSSTAANVIGRDPSKWNASILIDKGRRDGVAVGWPVVNALGVVGKVAEVSDDSAKVILITDPSFSVAALDQRSREVGLVSGSLQGLCRMRYLSFDADVQPQDQVITSKLSSSFPEGLLIGTITRVHKDENENTAYCLIEPSVFLSQIEQVLVIKTEPGP